MLRASPAHEMPGSIVSDFVKGSHTLCCFMLLYACRDLEII